MNICLKILAQAYDTAVDCEYRCFIRLKHTYTVYCWNNQPYTTSAVWLTYSGKVAGRLSSHEWVLVTPRDSQTLSLPTCRDKWNVSVVWRRSATTKAKVWRSSGARARRRKRIREHLPRSRIHIAPIVLYDIRSRATAGPHDVVNYRTIANA